MAELEPAPAALHQERIHLWRDLRAGVYNWPDFSRAFPGEVSRRNLSLTSRRSTTEELPTNRPALTLVHKDWQKVASILVEKANIDARLVLLERQISNLTIRLARAEASLKTATEAPIVFPLTNLAPAPYQIIGQVNILLQPYEEGFTAIFLDANLGSSGTTRSDAIDGIKDRIVETYERLINKSDDKLGPGPLRQKYVLSKMIGGLE